MKKVVLIIPPSPFLGDELRNPPLGILYVAAYMAKHGLDVRMVDLRTVPESEWMDKIPDCHSYGITATTPEYPYALKIARILKSWNPKCRLVLGGVHATALPDSVDPVFDMIRTGEYDRCPGENLDSIPFPARHLLPRKSFISDKLCGGGDATTLIVSRGCAYDCSFCSSKMMWNRKVQYRSVRNVLDEMYHLTYTYGIKRFRFHDDTMTMNKSWIMEFCKRVARYGYRWRTATRVNHSDRDVLQAMYDAGCYDIAFGIEDPCDEVLRINGKRISVNDMYRAIGAAKAAGLKIRLFLMIGLPGQDENTSKRINDFIDSTEPDAVDLSTFVPFPGCDIYNHPDKYGITLKNVPWDDYVFTRGLYGDEYKKDFPYQHDKLSNESLKRQRKEILDHIMKYKMDLNR